VSKNKPLDTKIERSLEQALNAIDVVRAIEAELTTHLPLGEHSRSAALRSENADASAPFLPLMSAVQLGAFADHVASKSLKECIGFLDEFLHAGRDATFVVLEILAPAARHLGRQWAEDRITFVDVTLGVSRLQQLLRVYGPAMDGQAAAHSHGHRILLATVPGEQHSFGLAVVEEFFRCDGWDVQTDANASRPLLLRRARAEWFDVIGLSASGDIYEKQVEALIKQLRSTSLNPDVRIMVGGCSFNADPDKALAMGADFATCSAREAVRLASQFVASTKLQ
jgi:MerR family transcriptional regulator, light-induced transcriptional regulator